MRPAAVAGHGRVAGRNRTARTEAAAEPGEPDIMLGRRGVTARGGVGNRPFTAPWTVTITREPPESECVRATESAQSV